MRDRKNVALLLIYTFLITACIFVGRSIFFPSVVQEESYIEPIHNERQSASPEDFASFSGVTQQTVDSALADIILQQYSQDVREDVAQEPPFRFLFLPSDFSQRAENIYPPIMESYLRAPFIFSQIEDLTILLHEYSADTRGRMKSEKIFLYGMEHLGLSEFLSLFIHEYAHYVDIYSFARTAFGDESQIFYNISWDRPTQMRAGSRGKDFVSGYAMTNQYEDFAESYTMYVLHNQEFAQKASRSTALARKYSFFQRYVFPENVFYKEDFSQNHSIKDYYWDITKLPVDVKKFLQYLQSDI